MEEKLEKLIQEAHDDGMMIDEACTDIMALFQAQHEQDIKAFEEMIGEDEKGSRVTLGDYFAAAENKNILRAELRTKLAEYKKENI